MIGRLRGTLAEKQPPHLILDVNGLGLFAKPEKLLNERLEMLRQTLGA